MGQRSLYYAMVDGCLYAASQPSLLLKFREVPDTPDAEALAYRPLSAPDRRIWATTSPTLRKCGCAMRRPVS